MQRPLNFSDVRCSGVTEYSSLNFCSGDSAAWAGRANAAPFQSRISTRARTVIPFEAAHHSAAWDQLGTTRPARYCTTAAFPNVLHGA